MKEGALQIDLTPYGYDFPIQFEGNVIEEFCVKERNLIFVFDENHKYLPGIRQSLRNAVELINAGIVDFVGVEGFTGNVRKIVEPYWRGMGYPSIEHARQRFRNMKISRKLLIETGDSFAKMLVFLKPDVFVYGIEDPDTYEEIGKAIDKWRESLLEEAVKEHLDAQKNNYSLSHGTSRKKHLFPETKTWPQFIEQVFSKPNPETDRFVQSIVEGSRPRHFVENLFKLRKETGAALAAILNAGRMDQDAVCRILREEKRSSFIRIRPKGFPYSRGWNERERPNSGAT